MSELKMILSEGRDKLLKEAGFHITIPPEQGLAMKADLCLPWRKLRVMKRWMKSWGANMASEGKQRSLMKSQLSELPVEGESVPFAFNLKRGGYELCPAPLAYANDLQSMLFHLLEEKQRLNQLTWHNGVIPDNEIWVKIGGDKGGSSFKTSIQVVNIDKPNSVRNSCVFVVFEAPDCSSNLHHKIHDQIDHLQNSCWRGYTIRVFMSGDYEFLCYMYGLSGAS
uniref:Uncharacterized protein n=1 Tax=Amphimedon queenslandica TaxID=400682 RepID=A0A1X7UTE9_AMPQE